MIKLNLEELKIIERLLKNRLNADFDNEVEELLSKVRKEINETEHAINQVTEWSESNGRNLF